MIPMGPRVNHVALIARDPKAIAKNAVRLRKYCRLFADDGGVTKKKRKARRP